MQAPPQSPKDDLRASASGVRTPLRDENRIPNHAALISTLAHPARQASIQSFLNPPQSFRRCKKWLMREGLESSVELIDLWTTP